MVILIGTTLRSEQEIGILAPSPGYIRFVRFAVLVFCHFLSACVGRRAVSE
jgi:hypothetical protein